jgi:large subunit ribosomal protein L17
MFRNMVTSLLKYERIRTTGAKAKELRRWADHVITLAKRGDLHARRQALAIVREKEVVHKLFEQAAERFGAASGGYTRIVKLGLRPGDAAPISLVELVYSEDTKKKKTKKRKVKAGVGPKKAAPDKKAATDEMTQKKETEKPKKTAKTKATKADEEAESASDIKRAGNDKEVKPTAKDADTREDKADLTKEDKAEMKASTEKQDTPDPAKKKQPSKESGKQDK